jgi:hypothetical protein
MTKTKVMVVLTLTVVMLTAMAGQVVGWGGSIEAADSSGVTTYVFVEGEDVYATFVGNGGVVNIYLTDDAEWTEGDDIVGKNIVKTFSDVVCSSNTANPSLLLVGTVASGDIPFPGTYDLAMDGNQDGKYHATDDAVCNVPIGCHAFETKVPEFSTIALPVVSILGLLLFFNRRKHKKE